MALKAIIASVLAAGTVAAASTAHPPARVAPSPCAVSARPAENIAAAMRGGVLVSRKGSLALVGGPAVSDGTRPAGGVVRHVSSDPGFGVTYVVDRLGGDVVVIDTPTTRTEVERPGEVSHPAGLPGGDVAWGEGAKLRIWSAATGEVTSSPAPVRSGLVFSPVPVSRNAIIAAVTEPIRGTGREDEQLSNLWRYDSRRGRWQQVTGFTATQDRWSVVRTPQAEPGGVSFVRVHGSASATVDPTFELWSLTGGHAKREEVLPGERYLAGYRDGHRLWNLTSDQAGTWVLASESDSGLREMGCGAVEVDPVDVPDPDRSSAARGDEPAPGYPVPPPSPVPPAHEVAVLVGDYAGESGATNAAEAILAAYGSDAQVKVVSSDTAPTAVKPGSWAAILWIGAQGDPVSAIQRFREKLPQFADRSWVAAP